MRRKSSSGRSWCCWCGNTFTGVSTQTQWTCSVLVRPWWRMKSTREQSGMRIVMSSYYWWWVFSLSLSLPDWHGANLRSHCDAEWVRAAHSIHPVHQLIHSLLAPWCCHTWRLMPRLHFVTLWLRKSIWTSNIGFPACAGWEIAEGPLSERMCARVFFF